MEETVEAAPEGSRAVEAEMEETVEAAATVTNYLGASILEAKCRELVAQARGAEEAAHVARMDRTDLNLASRQLEEAGGEGRLLAVVNLRDASAALEGAVRAQLDAIHRAAEKLSRSCSDYRDTVNAMEKILPAKEEPAGQAAGSWWSSLWRIRGRQQGVRQNLLDDVEAAAQPKRQRDAGAGPRCHRRRGWRPRAPWRAAGGHRRDGAGGRPRGTSELRRGPRRRGHRDEAADSAPLKAVRNRAAELARACRELKQAAEAMVRVQRAAAELRERRVAGSWWSYLRGKRRRRGEQRVDVLEDAELHGPRRSRPPAPGPPPPAGLRGPCRPSSPPPTVAAELAASPRPSASSRRPDLRAPHRRLAAPTSPSPLAPPKTHGALA
ncbi:hypothetical protein PVAP13_5KG694833 [Panicum virgatum]|uniref:Uncharacterized protein n=1 Tax=Panicum virgatum TaxID=38727 RepID=A0A8T0SWN1_PANVG|nr:hypothetical protein PVAP13_5KG694833 [Panicum virgatum]